MTNTPPDTGHAAFRQMLRFERVDGQVLTTEIQDGWQQGRGAFGGLVLGLMAEAMRYVEDSDRPLRSLTGEIPAPVVPGTARFTVDTIRRGRNLSTHSCALRIGDETVARASTIFGGARSSAEDVQLSTLFGPDCLHWKEPSAVPAIPAAMLPIPFSQHFEYRPTGPRPLQGLENGTTEGWIAIRGGSGSLGPAELIALTDAYWPAYLVTQRAMRPSATVAFALHTTPDAWTTRADEPVYMRAQAEHAAGGYCFERREMYAPSGALIAINFQTFAIIK